MSGVVFCNFGDGDAAAARNTIGEFAFFDFTSAAAAAAAALLNCFPFSMKKSTASSVSLKSGCGDVPGEAALVPWSVFGDLIGLDRCGVNDNRGDGEFFGRSACRGGGGEFMLLEELSKKKIRFSFFLGKIFNILGR